MKREYHPNLHAFRIANHVTHIANTNDISVEVIEISLEKRKSNKLIV
jgi:hypothetical protein